jgi:hypothetical protein
LRDKHFMTADDVPGGLVAVTAGDGPIHSSGAPSDLFSRLTDRVGDAIQQVGNLWTRPLVVGAQARASITIIYGDPIDADDGQDAFSWYPTLQSGLRIASLIDSSGADLFAHALQLGTAAQAYVELTNLVRSEGLHLEWEMLGDRPRQLSHERASQQYEQLSKPPQERRHEMQIDGLLYRAIYDGPGEGRVGIRLSKHSSLPPRHRGRTVIAQYDSVEIEDQILHHLLGQTVFATVNVVEYKPFSSVIQIQPPYPTIERIVPGRSYEPSELIWDEEDELGHA